jgi:hypothetical protein
MISGLRFAAWFHRRTCSSNPVSSEYFHDFAKVTCCLGGRLGRFMFQTCAETSAKFFDRFFLRLRGRHSISYQAFVGDDLLVDIPTHLLPGDFDLREDCSQQAFCDMIQ